MLKNLIEKVIGFFVNYGTNTTLPFAIVNALMALSYSILGVFLALFPDSYFAQNFLPSKVYVYGLATLLIVYGLFRAWRVYKKFKDDDDDEYEYYDGRKG
jgi:hypothetical protein